MAPPSRRSEVRVAVAIAALVALAIVVFMLGPRNALGPDTPTQRPMPPDSIAALDLWLAANESQFPDIKPGNAKGIIWYDGQRRRTPWSVIYLHGFSASRQETAPVTERVAEALGANAYYTRFAGHGRQQPDAMGEASAQDWMADATEALRIGQTLGDRVLIISCSTGATLATWLATGENGNKVAAHVFISPNFGPKDKRSEIINGPWGKQIALALEGDYRSWPNATLAESNAWTTRYPTRALFPMMAMVKQVRESDLSVFQTPLLVLYSDKDETVDPIETQAAFTRIGSALKSIEPISYSQSKGQHVLAGAIKDPNAVAPMATTIAQWAQSLPKDFQ